VLGLRQVGQEGPAVAAAAMRRALLPPCPASAVQASLSSNDTHRPRSEFCSFQSVFPNASTLGTFPALIPFENRIN